MRSVTGPVVVIVGADDHQRLCAVLGYHLGVVVFAVPAARRLVGEAIAVSVDAVDAVTVVVRFVTDRIRGRGIDLADIVAAVLASRVLAGVPVAVRIDTIMAVTVVVSFVTDGVASIRMNRAVVVVTVGSAR